VTHSRPAWLVTPAGPVPYDAANEAMHDLAARRLAGSIPDVVVLLEHPPVGDQDFLQLLMDASERPSEEKSVHVLTPAAVFIEPRRLPRSPRARNLGAVAGGAAAGALIGKAAGGGKGALIGGLIGGAAAGAGVAASKGYQVVIKEGTPLTFTVDEDKFVKS